MLKFVTRISKSGTKRNIIIIPKEFKKKTDRLDGKQVRVIIDDII